MTTTMIGDATRTLKHLASRQVIRESYSLAELAAALAMLAALCGLCVLVGYAIQIDAVIGAWADGYTACEAAR